MTAIRQQHVLSPVRETALSARLDGLTLSWEVLPDAPGVPGLLAGKPTPARVRLVLSFGHNNVRVLVETAGNSNPAERRPIGDPIPASLTSAESDGLVHVDVPGVLLATLRLAQDESPRVLYARTSLLESLGFPGGTYDRPEATWERRGV